MPRAAALLRALLCLVLLLNGAGYAHAATRMAIDALPVAASVDAEPPCHGDAAMAMGHASKDAPASGEAPAMPDCCPSDGCDGPCDQHAPALPWPSLVTPVQAVHASAPAYRTLDHASAPLAHRHRPPISLA